MVSERFPYLNTVIFLVLIHGGGKLGVRYRILLSGAESKQVKGIGTCSAHADKTSERRCLSLSESAVFKDGSRWSVGDMAKGMGTLTTSLARTSLFRGPDEGPRFSPVRWLETR